ncbi:SRPBCC family protein [Leucobacter sp.]
MIPLGPVVARSRLKAARTAVWSYLAEPERRAAWWPGLQLEAGVGGAIALRAAETAAEPEDERDAEGTVDVWVEGHAVGFTWREAGEDRGTAVLMTLRSQGRETGVTITETGFDALAAPAERAAASQRGWQELLAGLAAAIAGAEAAEDPDADPAEEPAADAAEHPAEEPAESGGEDPDASTGGALEVAPEPVDGEVDDSEGADVEIVEVDAEPQVGDHLELDTGSVRVVDAADAPGTLEHGAPEGAVERDAVEDGAAEEGPGAQAAAEYETSEHDTIEIQRLVEAEKPEEPDFDTLIRGA